MLTAAWCVDVVARMGRFPEGQRKVIQIDRAALMCDTRQAPSAVKLMIALGALSHPCFLSTKMRRTHSTRAPVHDKPLVEKLSTLFIFRRRIYLMVALCRVHTNPYNPD